MERKVKAILIDLICICHLINMMHAAGLSVPSLAFFEVSFRLHGVCKNTIFSSPVQL